MLTSRNVFSVFFDIGFSAVPRIESVPLSFVYRKTLGELYFYFALPVTALIAGILLIRLFSAKGRASLVGKVIYAALIAFDLAVRLLPFRFNESFGLLYGIIGFAARLVCLALVIADIIMTVKRKKEE